MTAPAHDTASGIARDLVFLAVAGDDELAALGFGYATVRMTAGGAPDPVPAGTLVLHWSDPESSTWGRRRQRVCLSVAGRRPPALVTAALQRAGAVLRSLPVPRPPIVAITPSAPLVQLRVAGRAVTTGFEILTRADPLDRP